MIRNPLDCFLFGLRQSGTWLFLLCETSCAERVQGF